MRSLSRVYDCHSYAGASQGLVRSIGRQHAPGCIAAHLAFIDRSDLHDDSSAGNLVTPTIRGGFLPEPTDSSSDI